jgi:hypothetical protein
VSSERRATLTQRVQNIKPRRNSWVIPYFGIGISAAEQVHQTAFDPYIQGE